MTVIRLDASTLARVQSGKGPVYLADENGKLVLTLTGTAPVGSVPDREPELTDEEWKRRMDPTNGMTTAQMLEYLKGLGAP